MTIKQVDKIDDWKCIERDQDGNTVSISFLDSANGNAMPASVFIQRTNGKFSDTIVVVDTLEVKWI